MSRLVVTDGSLFLVIPIQPNAQLNHCDDKAHDGAKTTDKLKSFYVCRLPSGEFPARLYIPLHSAESRDAGQPSFYRIDSHVFIIHEILSCVKFFRKLPHKKSA